MFLLDREQERQIFNHFVNFVKTNNSTKLQYAEFSHHIILKIKNIPQEEYASCFFDTDGQLANLIQAQPVVESLTRFFSKISSEIPKDSIENLATLIQMRAIKFKALLLTAALVAFQDSIREGKGLGGKNLSFFYVESGFLLPEEAKDETLFLPLFRETLESHTKLLDSKNLLNNVVFSGIYFYSSFLILFLFFFSYLVFILLF